MLVKKKGLKTMKAETLNLPPGKIICNNENLSPYHKKLRSICKKLRSNESISSFLVNNGSVALKLLNERVFITTHLSDLEELFLGNPILLNSQTQFSFFGITLCCLILCVC